MPTHVLLTYEFFFSYTATFIDFLFSHSIPQKLCLLLHITFRSKETEARGIPFIKMHNKAVKLIVHLLKIYRNGTRLYILLFFYFF